MNVEKDQLVQAIKEIIIDECDKDMAPEEIGDDDLLIGGGLDLDSLDALQISLAIKSRYGVRIEGGPKARTVFQSVNSLADFVLSEMASAS
jgi:acyl carrier protein